MGWLFFQRHLLCVFTLRSKYFAMCSYSKEELLLAYLGVFSTRATSTFSVAAYVIAMAMADGHHSNDRRSAPLAHST